MKIYPNKFQRTQLKQTTIYSLVLLILLAFASPAIASNPNGPFPKKFYVSRNGDNTDGLSWATAWNEMEQIDWSKLNPQLGDQLEIDGGVSYMYYQTPLNIQRSGTNQGLFRVGLSRESGHNGRAIIYGANKPVAGITVNGRAVHLTGTKRGGIMVCGWGRNGLVLPEGTGGESHIDGLEICYNSVNGVLFRSGLFTFLSGCNIHDNKRNVLVDPSSAINGHIERCWIYNSSYRRNSDGIIMGNGTDNPLSFVEKCVIGPGLRRGFAFKGANSYTSFVTDCLFINASKTNISTLKGIYVSKCTSFMTPKNFKGRVHGCIAINQHQPNHTLQAVEKSIFYGGRVLVSPTIPYTTRDNTQFRTVGNTVFLSSTLTDPMFTTDVSNYPNNVSISTLINTDFSLKPGSPAQGTGSSITSVRALIRP